MGCTAGVNHHQAFSGAHSKIAKMVSIQNQDNWLAFAGRVQVYCINASLTEKEAQDDNFIGDFSGSSSLDTFSTAPAYWSELDLDVGGAVFSRSIAQAAQIKRSPGKGRQPTDTLLSPRPPLAHQMKNVETPALWYRCTRVLWCSVCALFCTNSAYLFRLPSAKEHQ